MMILKMTMMIMMCFFHPRGLKIRSAPGGGAMNYDDDDDNEYDADDDDDNNDDDDDDNNVFSKLKIGG